MKGVEGVVAEKWPSQSQHPTHTNLGKGWVIGWGKVRSACSNDYDFDRVRFCKIEFIIVFVYTRCSAHTKIVA